MQYSFITVMYRENIWARNEYFIWKKIIIDQFNFSTSNITEITQTNPHNYYLRSKVYPRKIKVIE